MMRVIGFVFFFLWGLIGIVMVAQTTDPQAGLIWIGGMIFMIGLVHFPTPDYGSKSDVKAK